MRLGYNQEMASLQSKDRRLMRFSLRGLLVLIVLLAAPLGWAAAKLNKVRRQRAAIAALQQAGLQAEYSDRESRFPELQRTMEDLLGADGLRDVEGFYMYNVVSHSDDQSREVQFSIDEGLAHIRLFTKLRYLFLNRMNMTGASLRYLQGLPQLASLRLDGSNISDAWLAHLEAVPHLKALGLEGTKITDAGLVHVRRLGELEYLNLAGTSITDSGVAHLRALDQLTDLVLSNTAVTDDGLEPLQKLAHLSELWLGSTHVTHLGVLKLKRERPNLSVVR